jgi:cobalamin synthase
MARARRRRWQFGLRSLLVGTAAAAVAVSFTTWIDVPGDLVMIVAVIVAVLLEATIHRHGLRWLMGHRRRTQ